MICGANLDLPPNHVMGDGILMGRFLRTNLPARTPNAVSISRRPAHVVEVLVVAGPHSGTVGVVDWCEEHENLFYAQQKDEYVN